MKSMFGMWRVAILSVLVAGCTKHNPVQCDDNHNCGDPNNPFCDIDGIVGGIANACIPGSCTPGATLACRGSTRSVCNELGFSYDDTTCALGCADDTRCFDLDPSNGFATILDQAATGPDVELVDGDLLVIDTGSVLSSGTERIRITGTLTPSPSHGVPVAAFPVHSLHVSGSVSFAFSTTNAAIAFVAAGPITIDGTLDVPVGFVDNNPPCVGMDGMDDGGALIIYGAGGGGNATAGADGGLLPDSGGSAFADPTLVPLRGGCAGGKGFGGAAHGFGGGAIQLSSSVSISLSSTARILANGRLQTSALDRGAGGGAGGGILLEAPTVSIAAGGVLSANGTGGAAGDGSAPTSPTDGSPSRGGVCAPTQLDCAPGGDGNSATAGPTPVDETTGGSKLGGGGGAGGSVRINTLDGTFNAASSMISPSPTSGMIHLR